MAWSVMVVDDEPMTRTLLQLMLAPADCEVVEAEDGLDALEKVKEKLPDVIVLDVMMPNMDGITLCRVLRDDPQTADLPIILLSAKTSAEAIQEGLLAGANKYLTKPVARHALVSSIEEVLAVTVHK
ncbi:MAG: response regulator [Anaerolineales bacterium]|nr:response regulator [Anaerolineales bacterium]MCB8986603.1 response regulator [Ardenticatenaceae bacterium]